MPLIGSNTNIKKEVVTYDEFYALQVLTLYPVPRQVLDTICRKRGVAVETKIADLAGGQNQEIVQQLQSVTPNSLIVPPGGTSSGSGSDDGAGLSTSDKMGEVVNAGRVYSAAFYLAKADLLMWLSLAPNVAQGGQNYSFTDDQRQQMRSQARQLYAAYGKGDNAAEKPVYGYKGGSL